MTISRFEHDYFCFNITSASFDLKKCTLKSKKLSKKLKKRLNVYMSSIKGLITEVITAVLLELAYLF